MVAHDVAGTTGQRLSFAFWGSRSGPSADIYSPSGQPLATIYGVANGEPGAVNLTLTNSGTYTILVHAVNYDVTGSYGLSIQSITGGGCNSTPVVCGQTVNMSISTQAQIAAYGFGTGGKGTVIFSFSGSSYGGAQFDLYDPMGNQVFTGTPSTATSTNLAAGTYTLLVHAVNYDSTGSYGFTVTCINVTNYSINPTSVSVGAAATNGTVAVTVTPPGPWTATTTNSWLRITNGSSGYGNGTVSYTVDANGSTSAREGAMTIAGFTFNVNQAGLRSLTDIDIGIPGAAGSLGVVTNGVYTVSGSGEGIFTTGDVFNFAYLPMQGDGMIVARLVGMQPDNRQCQRPPTRL